MNDKPKMGRPPIILPDDVVARYISGELTSAAAVAREVGCCWITAHARLRDLGVNRSRAGSNNLSALARGILLRQPYHERNLRMVQLRASGWTLASIGAEYGLTRERVRQILKRENHEPATKLST